MGSPIGNQGFSGFGRVAADLTKSLGQTQTQDAGTRPAGNNIGPTNTAENAAAARPSASPFDAGPVTWSPQLAAQLRALGLDINNAEDRRQYLALLENGAIKLPEGGVRTEREPSAEHAQAPQPVGETGTPDSKLDNKGEVASPTGNVTDQEPVVDEPPHAEGENDGLADDDVPLSQCLAKETVDESRRQNRQRESLYWQQIECRQANLAQKSADRNAAAMESSAKDRTAEAVVEDRSRLATAPEQRTSEQTIPPPKPRERAPRATTPGFNYKSYPELVPDAPAPARASAPRPAPASETPTAPTPAFPFSGWNSAQNASGTPHDKTRRQDPSPTTVLADGAPSGAKELDPEGFAQATLPKRTKNNRRPFVLDNPTPTIVSTLKSNVGEKGVAVDDPTDPRLAAEGEQASQLLNGRWATGRTSTPAGHVPRTLRAAAKWAAAKRGYEGETPATLANAGKQPAKADDPRAQRQALLKKEARQANTHSARQAIKTAEKKTGTKQAQIAHAQNVAARHEVARPEETLRYLQTRAFGANAGGTDYGKRGYRIAGLRGQTANGKDLSPAHGLVFHKMDLEDGMFETV
ncbi:MAG: hypothetical protein H6729_16580 [Deltaproteobacteria bacterium]|nr:hypothetical protein [Deltaproteobacteria bacterium]